MDQCNCYYCQNNLKMLFDYQNFNKLTCINQENNSPQMSYESSFFIHLARF